MSVWVAPVVGGVADVVGNLLGGGHSRRERERAQRYNDGVRREQREWFLSDRDHDEAYNAERLADDREYAAGLLADERDHVRSVTEDTRAYDRRRLLDDRQYSERRLANDRAYMARMRDDDIAQYSSDRDFMQARSNRLAERTAASRGIDFTRLRDDAVAAGYNPMTALAMAHAYSTQVDYSLQGGVYSPGASYTAAGPGYNATSGGGTSGGAAAGGGVAPMSTPSSSVAAGGFNLGGSGYQSRPDNGLISAGSTIADAMARAADTWFNSPPDNDPLADALRNIEDSYNVSLSAQQAQIPQGFGYSLTDQKPFRPALSVKTPPLRDQSKQLAPPKPVAEESPSDGSVAVSQKPIKVFGKDFKPQSGSSDASAAEDRYGEIGGEVIGLSSLAYDGVKSVADVGASIKESENERKGRRAQKEGRRAYKVNGKWYIEQESIPHFP